jgi:hypothetical protein
LKRRSREEDESDDEDDVDDLVNEGKGNQDIADDSKSAPPSSHSGPSAEESTAEV